MTKSQIEVRPGDFTDAGPEQHFCMTCGFPDAEKLPRRPTEGTAMRLPFTWQQYIEIHQAPWSVSFTLFLTEHGSATIEWVHRISGIDVAFDLGLTVIKTPLEKPIILGHGQVVKVIASTTGHRDRGTIALAGCHFVRIIPAAKPITP